MSVSRLIGGVVMVLAGAGCTFTRVGPNDALLNRAAFDLQCPKDQVQLAMIDAKTSGATACGKQATYLEVCRGPNRYDCTWVLNGTASQNPPPPSQ